MLLLKPSGGASVPIAFGNAALGSVGSANGATSWTFSYPLGVGSNFLILYFLGAADGIDHVTGATYAGAAMTRSTISAKYNAANWVYAYYLVNPAPGTNNIVISASGIGGSDTMGAGMVMDYKGAATSGQPDSTSFGNSGGTGAQFQNVTTNVVNANSWVTYFFFPNGTSAPNTISPGAKRAEYQYAAVFDSNGPIATPGNYNATLGAVDIGHPLTAISLAIKPS